MAKIFARRAHAFLILSIIILAFFIVICFSINAPSQAADSSTATQIPISTSQPATEIFEYGGQVIDTTSPRAISPMRKAGMTWMKLQMLYSLGTSSNFEVRQIITAKAQGFKFHMLYLFGTSSSDVAGQISAAKAQGFKILITLVGDRDELAAGGDSYIEQFASFARVVAHLGPDAIEVWNEPNIDRTWPMGQISGAYYTRMLHAAYDAIKAANSDVMVISGAPFPTGAEPAFPGRVVNDYHFIQDLVSSGGLQYMDCLGAHYLEGAVPPAQNSGDPRDSYYTRYFGSMLTVYWAITGGQKPICWTELGYITLAGYRMVNPYYDWASNTTIAQQAAWLAQATTLSAESGKVRLLIVYMVDGNFDNADALVGYGMIRADGSCPACDTMVSALTSAAHRH